MRRIVGPAAEYHDDFDPRRFQVVVDALRRPETHQMSALAAAADAALPRQSVWPLANIRERVAKFQHVQVVVCRRLYIV